MKKFSNFKKYKTKSGKIKKVELRKINFKKYKNSNMYTKIAKLINDGIWAHLKHTYQLRYFGECWTLFMYIGKQNIFDVEGGCHLQISDHKFKYVHENRETNKRWNLGKPETQVPA